MKYLLILSICALLTQNTYAQTDTITIKQTWAGPIFRKDDKLLTAKQVETIVKTDEKAFKEYQKSKAPAIIGYALAFTGGALVGYDLGRALGSGDAVNPAVLATGAGIICVSFPFSGIASRHIRRSVELYNKNLHATVGREPKYNMYIFASANRMGIRLAF